MLCRSSNPYHRTLTLRVWPLHGREWFVTATTHTIPPPKLSVQRLYHRRVDKKHREGFQHTEASCASGAGNKTLKAGTSDNFLFCTYGASTHVPHPTFLPTPLPCSATPVGKQRHHGHTHVVAFPRGGPAVDGPSPLVSSAPCPPSTRASAPASSSPSLSPRRVSATVARSRTCFLRRVVG